MSKKKSSYTRYNSEYKTEALKLVKQVGVASAARHLIYTNLNFIAGANKLNTNKQSVIVNLP